MQKEAITFKFNFKNLNCTKNTKYRNLSSAQSRLFMDRSIITRVGIRLQFKDFSLLFIV